MNQSIQQHWERARDALAQGRLAAARAHVETMRVGTPDDWRTHLAAARLAWVEDHPKAAAEHALAAARAAPGDADGLGEVVDVLLQTGETAMAHDLLDRPLWRQVPSGTALLRYADFRQRLGEHAQALVALERLAPADVPTAALHWYRGQQLEFLGRLAEAGTAYEACLADAPGYGQAAYQWVRLGLPAASEHQLAAIDAGLRAARTDSREQSDFLFARYHVLETLGHTDDAWNALAHANAIVHAHVAADVARQREGLGHFIRELAAHPVRTAQTRPTGPCPIFVIGLPRSGTTVIERMLANHSRVVSAGELPDFGHQLLRVADTRSNCSAAFFARLPTLDCSEIGRRYLAQTAWRATDHAYLIDKQPANWMLTGLIHAALPGARIVHVVRDPMDVCFSLWRARFASTYAWSYDFGALAAEYAQYRQLIAYWHAACPGAILDVAYAELVRAPAEMLRKVMDYCGLRWEPGCEDLTRNVAPVCTLSAAQVRGAVHARALGQWRRYAHQLEPLRQRLADIV